MVIRQYTYVDVYWNEGEQDKAIKERRRLIKLGYELSVEDFGKPHDNCDQYIRYKKQIEL